MTDALMWWCQVGSQEMFEEEQQNEIARKELESNPEYQQWLTERDNGKEQL